MLSLIELLVPHKVFHFKRNATFSAPKERQSQFQIGSPLDGRLQGTATYM